jgi:hypothetical protein
LLIFLSWEITELLAPPRIVNVADPIPIVRQAILNTRLVAGFIVTVSILSLSNIPEAIVLGLS